MQSEYQTTDASISSKLKAHAQDVKAWQDSVNQAQNSARDFISSQMRVDISAFVSRDPAGMAVAGIVLSAAPDQAIPNSLIPIPESESTRFKDVADLSFIPNPGTDDGRQLMALLDNVSQSYRNRPLLAGVEGVKPLALSGGQLVLSTTRMTHDGGVVLMAAPEAVIETSKFKMSANDTQTERTQRTVSTKQSKMTTH